MDPARSSRIRHSTLQLCSPILDRDVTEICKLLAPAPGGRVVEIGCGKAEILARVLEATSMAGLGIDLPGSLAEELSPRATALVRERRLELRLQNAQDALLQPDSPLTASSFDVVILCGASQALGGFPQALSAVKSLLKPRGRLVLGELAWREKPDSKFLEDLSMSERDLPLIATIPGVLAAAGFETLRWSELSKEQFHQYEKTLNDNGLAYAASRPKDPQAQELRSRSEDWFRLVNEAGLRFFSFGWGLFQARN